MKIQPYIQKLQNSKAYKEFQQGNKGAFLIAGFFVIDFEEGKNLHQIDYYVPAKKKVAAFTLDKSVVVQMLSLLDKKVPDKLDINTNIDLDALNGIIQDEMKNRNITQSIKKMIAVVQNIKGKAVWNVNCVLSGMDLLKVHVEDETQSILRMDKSSLMDYVKRMPGSAGQAPVAPEKKATAPTGMSKEVIEEKIAQLDKMKELLKKEEIDLEKNKEETVEVEKASSKKRKK